MKQLALIACFLCGGALAASQSTGPAPSSPRNPIEPLTPSQTFTLHNGQLARNEFPAPPPVSRPWPKAKAVPIPTQWPNARIEPIPTRWPGLKLQLLDQHTPGSAPVDGKAK